MDTIHECQKYLVQVQPYKLQFRYKFRLASGSRSHTELVLLTVFDKRNSKLEFYGEAALPPYLGESIDSVRKFYQKVGWTTLLEQPLTDSAATLGLISPNDNAAKASVDIMLHDKWGKIQNQNISEMYAIPQRKITTTFTIGISNKRELKTKLRDAQHFTILKLKLGSADDLSLVKQFLGLSNKAFCVDVNQGWHNRDEAARLADYLVSQGVLFIEQPFAKDDMESTYWLSQRCNALLVADESAKEAQDLSAVAQCFGGVNIKLMKSCGIIGAMKMITRARALDMKVIIGAMAETSCANTAAAHLASLADWVDLDGPLLSTNDPFIGIHYNEGEIRIPEGSGVGVVTRQNLMSPFH